MADRARQESFSGYTLAIVDSVTKLTRYLKEVKGQCLDIKKFSRDIGWHSELKISHFSDQRIRGFDILPRCSLHRGLPITCIMSFKGQHSF